MRYYPLLLDLHEKTCLVVGTGRVGTRKIRTLLKASPQRVVAMDTAPATTELLELAAKNPALIVTGRAFTPRDLDGTDLVFACTNNRELNSSIARACREKKILCNITDAPHEGDVVLPSIVERGDLLLALSTSGTSPALCKKIRQELDCRFGQEYELLLVLMGRIRSTLLTLGQNPDENAVCFRALVNSSLTDAIRDRNSTQVRTILRSILPEQLHPSLGAMTHDLFSHI